MRVEKRARGVLCRGVIKVSRSEGDMCVEERARCVLSTGVVSAMHQVNKNEGELGKGMLLGARSI